MSERAFVRAPRDLAMLVLAVAAAIGVPVFFAYSSEIAGAIGSALRLVVAPAISGGRALAEFADPLGDDAGYGKLEYPLGPLWERGELDLTRYIVREPVTRPVWSGGRAYWQLEASFAKAVSCGLPGGGFRAPVIHIYISMEGAPAGSDKSAFGEGELVRFDPDHPWNYVVWADGWSPRAEIRSADGSYRGAVEQTWDLARRRLTLRIPLEGAPAGLASILAGRRTWHYVLVGAYDSAREGHFAAVREFAGLHDGGGASGPLCPRVYDLLAPRSTSKAAELSSENAERGELALVHPVEAIPAKPGASGEARAAVEAEAAREDAASAAARRTEASSLAPPSDTDAEILGRLFALGLDDRTFAAASVRLARRPGDPVALAYRGAIVAKSAQRAMGLGEKMRLVAQGYADLDAAAVAAGAAITAEDRIAVLVCRGSVSAAVPNDVFGRAAQGAADFEAAGSLAASAGDEATTALCLEGAAKAFEKAGLADEADARWATLAEREGLPASVRLELLDRGFY